MLEINFDQNKVEEMMLLEVQKKIKQLEHKHVFWSIEELCNQTSMSVNNIKDKFFYDPRFPKYKVGGRWLMPAKETEEFLLQWLKEQPRN